MNKVVLIAAAFAVAVCGSAIANEYRAAGPAGGPGYVSVQAENGRWVVAYTGDPDESDREIVEFALRRAGEVAAEQSQEWFAVISVENRMVDVAVANDLGARTGSFMGVGGPNRATFGGELVPDNVLERWQPRRARQTVLVIQLGSGDNASFPGVTEQPRIFPAAAR